MQAETRRRPENLWREGGQEFYRHGMTIRSTKAPAPNTAPYHHVAGRGWDVEEPIPIPWARIVREAAVGIVMVLAGWAAVWLFAAAAHALGIGG